MERVQFDAEIQYVQKLYFFMFLATFTIFACAITILRFGLSPALIVLGVGLGASYIAMLIKKNFNPPEKKITAQRMAHEISQDTSPLSIARFASQLYYYLHEPTQAISLLEKFLSSHDPLLCTTLGDILLKEGNPKRALHVLRANPNHSNDPLLLATQGRILKEVGELEDATKMFEQSLRFAKQAGFPHTGANWFTQKLLSISYTASIHHSLADCYLILDDSPQAKHHYRVGNVLLFDVSLWRRYRPTSCNSSKNYRNSQ